ncbi:MAG: hypothetical protein J0M02_00880 [Planctomycetes bacterium]|nr:hypothetical protein [Planctomycetota bacterium]
MRLAIIPTLILLASTVAAATVDAAPAVTGTCCAPAAPTAVAERPWYIGPKGGDLRQGKNGAAYRTAADTTLTAATPVVAVASERPWYIGPKGGDTRKGTNAALHSDATGVPTVAAAPAHCSRYVAPAVGPKGGLLKQKGQSDQDALNAADAACQSLCSR